MTRTPHQIGPAVALPVLPDATVAAAAEAGPPTRIELLPVGTFHMADARGAFTLPPARAAAIIAASLAAAPGGMLPIDFDHALENASRPPGTGRAAGWITALSVEGDRIVADVEWTPEGARAIAAREYRFISPVFTTKAREVRGILRAGLVNDPGLPQLRALAASQETLMDTSLPQIAEALGLDAAAEPEAVIAAARAAAARATAPDPAQFVPVAALHDVTRQLAALQADATAQRVERVVAAARAEGKLPPALDAWARDYAAKDPAGFDAWAAAQPVLVSAARVTPATAPAVTDAGLTDLEKQVCAQMGIAHDKFIATRKGAN